MTKKFLKIKVGEIMQERKLPLVEITTLIEDILPFPMNRHHVWVAESKGSKKIIGVVTEHDVLHVLCPRRGPYTFGFPDTRLLHKETAGGIMTKRVFKCSSEDTIEDVLGKMTRHGIRRLPVIEEDEIIGEVCVDHILDAFSTTVKRKRR